MGRPKRGGQTLIPGTDAEVVHEIEAAASAVRDLADEAKVASEARDRAAESLAGAMKRHGLTLYRCRTSGLTVEVDDKVRVKVKGKRRKDDDDAGAAGGSGGQTVN